MTLLYSQVFGPAFGGQFKERKIVLSQEERRHDFIVGTTKNAPNHIDLAKEATNTNDYLKHLIAAFLETYGDAINVEREDERYRNSKDRPIGVFINVRPVYLRGFESRIKDLQALPKLHTLFLEVNDWQKIYEDLEPLKKEKIDRFAYFVNKVANNPKSYDIIFYSAIEAHTSPLIQNPYAK